MEPWVRCKTAIWCCICCKLFYEHRAFGRICQKNLIKIVVIDFRPAARKFVILSKAKPRSANTIPLRSNLMGFMDLLKRRRENTAALVI